MLILISLISMFYTLWLMILFIKRSLIKNHLECICCIGQLLGWNLACLSISLYVCCNNPNVYMLNRFIYLTDYIWKLMRNMSANLVVISRLNNIGHFLFVVSMYIFICYMPKRKFTLANAIVLSFCFSVFIVNDPGIYILINKYIFENAGIKNVYYQVISTLNLISEAIFTAVLIICLIKLFIYWYKERNTQINKQIMLLIEGEFLILIEYFLVFGIMPFQLLYVYGGMTGSQMPNISIINFMNIVNELNKMQFIWSMGIYFLISILIGASFHLYAHSVIKILHINNYEQLKFITISERLSRNYSMNMLPFIHSIKNELIVLRQYLNFMDSDNYDILMPNLIKLSDDMNTMINRIYNNLHENRLNLSINSIGQVIRQIICNLSIPENIQFAVEGDNINAMVDTKYFSEVMINIFDNAIDACRSKENGLILVKISEKRKYIEIECTDNGVGVKKNDLNKIFDPFFSTKDNKQNWGLGLNYTYRIIRGHHGRVNFKSEYGRGSIITVYLPSVR